MARKRVKNFYKGELRDYELSLILHQSLSQEDLKKKIEEAAEIAKTLGAQVKAMQHTGLKSFAYPISEKNNKRGYYACVYLSMKPESIAELKRKISIQDNILRFMMILHNPKKATHGIFAANYEEESSRSKGKIIAYNDPNTLIRFIGERGRIDPRKQSLAKKVSKGLASRQRKASYAIKQARFMSLLSYVEE